jgi:predicted O-methyltransferase YrrM
VSTELWAGVDRYFNDLLVREDGVLGAAVEASAAAGLPAHQVTPSQGKLLMMMARVCGARNILEIGTLGGYSTIWMARALPAGGKLVTLEIEPKHAAVARSNIERAGLAGVAEVRVAPALESLALIAKEGRPPFDVVFIDADKERNADYFAWALKLSRPGSMIVIDNVVRGGAVADGSSTDSAVLGVRRLMELISGEARVSATAVQTVGSKGHDGFAVAVVLG